MSKSLPVLDSAPATPEGDAGFGSLSTSRGPLPLKALDVKAHILGLVTRVQVTQTFVNTHREPLEAVYIFPLPPRAAVSGFTMRVGGRLVVGTLHEREAARQRYAEALRKGQRASLAEEDRPNVFTLSVGNLMPGDVAEVAFELAGLLTLEGDEAEWRFPLVVAPRYIPGDALDVQQAGLGTTRDTDQVPDASRLNPPILLPGYPNPVLLGISVEWDPAGLPMDAIRSSLHAVTETLVEGKTRITLAQAERVDRDFILRCRLHSKQIHASAVLVRDGAGASDPDGGIGTVMVTLLPPAPGVSGRGRDVVFLLDRSGSMEGWKIVAARRAVARMVDTLGPDDRFEVVTFSTDLDFLGGETGVMRPASDRNRFQAVEFLTRTGAGGGTETAPAIQRAMALLQPGSRTRDAIVFLVTDGQVGNEDRLLRMVGKGFGSCRFQILGINEAINDGLLKRLADTTGGWFLAAESEDRLDAVLLKAGQKFGGPVVTEIRLQAPGVQWVKDALVSSGSLDLYPGTPLVLLGRCKAAPESLAVTGTGSQGPFGHTLPLATADEPSLRKVWARWRVRDLEDRLVREPREDRIRKQLVEISLSHGVLCRFTAFLAVDDATVVNPEGLLETIVQPVEAPRLCIANMLAVPSVIRMSQGRLASHADAEECFDLGFDNDACDSPLPCAHPSSSQAPASPGPAEDPRQAATTSAAGLLEFLEGLGPIAAHTTGTLEFPAECFELLRLLKDNAFCQMPVAEYLMKLLEEAKSRHRVPFQGRQERIQVLVSKLILVIKDFLKACGVPSGTTGSVKGPRAFWKP